MAFHPSLAFMYTRVFHQKRHSRKLFDEQLIFIAITPIFAGLERFDDWVPGRTKMPGGVLVLGGVAAADVPADQAQAKMHPAVPHRETFFATLCAGSHGSDLIQMSACAGHGYLLGY
jgi:hypothetical protein